MQIKKYIILCTIFFFTITQLPGCAIFNKDSNSTEYSISHQNKKTVDTSSDSSLINERNIKIVVGAVVITGILVLGGFFLANAIAKGAGEEMAGHIA